MSREAWQGDRNNHPGSVAHLQGVDWCWLFVWPQSRPFKARIVQTGNKMRRSFCLLSLVALLLFNATADAASERLDVSRILYTPAAQNVRQVRGQVIDNPGTMRQFLRDASFKQDQPLVDWKHAFVVVFLNSTCVTQDGHISRAYRVAAAESLKLKGQKLVLSWTDVSDVVNRVRSSEKDCRPQIELLIVRIPRSLCSNSKLYLRRRAQSELWAFPPGAPWTPILLRR